MFDQNIEYEIKRIYNGSGAKGLFSFITIEDKKKPNSKYADKVTVCVWGQNVDAVQGDSFIIKGYAPFGMVAKKDQKGEWSKEQQCVCKDFEIVKNGAKQSDTAIPQMTELPQSSEDNLPF